MKVLVVEKFGFIVTNYKNRYILISNSVCMYLPRSFFKKILVEFGGRMYDIPLNKTAFKHSVTYLLVTPKFKY